MTLVTSKLRRLWEYLRPYWRLELATFLVMALLAGLSLALPVAMQYLIDNLIPALSKQGATAAAVRSIVLFAAVLAGIYLANVLLSWLRDYLAGYIGAQIIADLRLKLFGHLESLSLRFYQSHQTGEIMSRLLNDVARIQDLLTSTLLMFLTNILLLAAILAYLLTVNWQLTLIAIIPVPLTILLSHRFGKTLHVISRSLQETVAELSARVQEALVAIKIIKAFGREDAEKKKAEGILRRLSGWYVKYSVARSLSMNLIQFVSMMGPIVVLSVGAYLVAGGGMKLGALIAFYVLLTYLYSPIQSLASVNVEVQSAMASVNRIYEYLDIPPAVEEASSPKTLAKARGEISLQNISFVYPDSGFKLENLTLSIPAGQTLAIVGPSGSGKTTLISLIMRFYDPDSGRITLDGVDLKELSLTSLRDNMALVDQDPLLFKATIGENIAYSNPDADQGEIVRAATIANIHEFISDLPEGYNSMVGERGVTLSGGEKQRICLARAVLKDPPILILDEATSSLDSISEQLIQKSLDRILRDKTAIIIAHRLATVQRADRIITLKDGVIVDEGTHSELLEKSPLYRELAQKQLKL
jgi:ABC-type multidrug transport system fused ATPase/permease subunit